MVMYPLNHASCIHLTTSKVLIKCSTIVLVPLPHGPMGVFHAKLLVSTTASSKDDDLPCGRNGAIVCMVSPASVTVIIRQCPVVHSVKCKDSSWQLFTFTLMLEGKRFTDSAAKFAMKSLLFQTI